MSGQSEAELLAVVDHHDRELAPQPRATVQAQRLWCRSVHVWIVNDACQVLCHQRSMQKPSNPGRWTPHFGGHNNPGERYAAAALRELREETGLRVARRQLRPYMIYKWTAGHKFQAVFVLHWNGRIQDLTINHDEVDQVAWRRPELIGQSGDWTHFGYETTLLAGLAGL